MDQLPCRDTGGNVPERDITDSINCGNTGPLQHHVFSSISHLSTIIEQSFMIHAVQKDYIICFNSFQIIKHYFNNFKYNLNIS